MVAIADIALAVAAADSSSLSSAARAANVSQPTMSRAVQRVETAIGQPLFEREGRSLRLLASSTASVDSLRVIVREWSSLAAGAGEQTEASTLSVFCTVTASQTIVAELLSSFRRTHPSIRLQLQTGPASAALDAVVHGEVDAAIAPLPRTLPRGLWAVSVATTPLVAVCALDIRSWADHALVLPRSGLTRELADRWRRKALGSHAVQETESHEEVVALAALGSGIGIVPKLVVDTSALRSRLRELAPPMPLPTMALGLVVRDRDRRRAEIAALCSMVRTVK